MPSSFFQNPSHIPIEDAWVDATTNINTYDAPSLWETLIFHTPVEQWRPDRPLSNKTSQRNIRGHVGVSTLAELWMLQHTNSANHKTWSGFLSRVAKTYPDLDAGVVLRAVWFGFSASYARAGRYEHAGSEDVLRDWLKAFPEAWKDQAKEKDALLAQAVELNLAEMSRDLLSAGADPQKSLRFVRSKELYDMLVKAGASTFERATDDPRNIDKLYESQRKVEGIKKDTVYESLLAREDKTFVSAQDREKIVGDMTRQRLKQSKGKPSAFSDDERASMLFKTIAEAKKVKEVLSGLKACLPQAWEWTDKQSSGVKINVLMALAQRRHLDAVYDQLGDRIPDSAWSQKDSQGKTLLEYAMHSSDGVSRPVTEAVWGKLKAGCPPNPDQAIRTLANAACTQGANTVGCPVWQHGVLTEEQMVQAERLNVWKLTPQEFWKAVDHHKKNEGNKWVVQLAKKLTQVSRYGYGADRSDNENWFNFLTDKKAKTLFKDRPEWATVALVTELNMAKLKINNAWGAKGPANALALRLAEAAIVKWAPLGADVELALPFARTGTDIISDNRSALIAAAERAMLTARTQKTIQATPPSTQRDLAL
jgi:hypothetical protein